MEQFPRIKRLPPYVFNITGELKAAARKRGQLNDQWLMGAVGDRDAHHMHIIVNCQAGGLQWCRV